MQYQKHKEDKSVMYYETFVECAIKIIENMGDYYDQLQLKKNTSDTQAVIRQLLEPANCEDANFPHICDFVEVLVQLNSMMPSHRFKITFLLEDFKCSKRLQKERDNLDNSEYQLMKNVLSLDPNNQAATSRIPRMLEQGNSQTLMKDYLFQFAEGTAKQVSRNIQLFTVMAGCAGICDALLAAFRQNVEGLFLIETDFPFMGKGLAGIMKTVCERKELNYQELKLGEEDHEDEDIRWFLQGIEAKYYKMIM